MKTVKFESPVFTACSVKFSISDLESVAGIILNVYAGACTIQTYATRDELRALGEMLLRHANDNEVLEVAA